MYDHTGVMGFTYQGQTYFYQKDLQGNIVTIVNAAGAPVAQYYYDAWGNHKVYDGDYITEMTSPTFIGNLNPFRYRGYYYDTETKLYYLQSRYYDPEVGRFISADVVEYTTAEKFNGLNLYAYCNNNPVMFADPDGNMPKWLKWVLGGVAVAGLIVATVLTCGAAGAGAAAVGAAMLAGGLISGAVNAIDQLHDGEDFDWTELAISTISGTLYGMVVGLTGGAAATWSWTTFGAKLSIAGGTSLLNSWNKELSTSETIENFTFNVFVSSICQTAGYGLGKLVNRGQVKLTMSFTKRIISGMWQDPAVKAGMTRLGGGIVGAIFNDIF